MNEIIKNKSKQAIQAMAQRAKRLVTEDIPQAGKVAGEIYGNIRYGKDYLDPKAMSARAIRGGFGDMMVNADQPNLRLVPKQMVMAQRAALPENAKVAEMLVMPGLINKLTKRPVKGAVKSSSKYLKDKAGKFIGSKSVKHYVE